MALVQRLLDDVLDAIAIGMLGLGVVCLILVCALVLGSPEVRAFIVIGLSCFVCFALPVRHYMRWRCVRALRRLAAPHSPTPDVEVPNG